MNALLEAVSVNEHRIGILIARPDHRVTIGCHPGRVVPRSSVGTAEQVAERLPPEQRHPAPAPVLRPVVDHVTPLTEGREVRVCVIRGVVVAMGSGQNNPGPAGTAEDVGPPRYTDPPAPPVAPPAGFSIPPPAVSEVIDHLSVRPTAALTASASPPEADHSRQLRPVDGVEEAVLAPDRHGGGTVPPAVKKA
jgi:hypothetical protein